MSTTAEAARPIGPQRGPWFVAIIGLVTLGIYLLYWAYKTGEEIKNYSGEGLGGALWLVLWFFLSIVMVFLAPSEVGRLYSREGQHPPVTGLTGFWTFIPFAGYFIWVIKVQNALNAFWASKGASPESAPAVDEQPAG
jgi:hypothetical protein